MSSRPNLSGNHRIYSKKYRYVFFSCLPDSGEKKIFRTNVLTGNRPQTLESRVSWGSGVNWLFSSSGTDLTSMFGMPNTTCGRKDNPQTLKPLHDPFPIHSPVRGRSRDYPKLSVFVTFVQRHKSDDPLLTEDTLGRTLPLSCPFDHVSKKVWDRHSIGQHRKDATILNQCSTHYLELYWYTTQGTQKDHPKTQIPTRTLGDSVVGTRDPYEIPMGR